MNPHPAPVRFGLALALIVTSLALATSAFGAAVALTPRDAIERAIIERMGGNVSVLVAVLRSDVTSEPNLRALPDPAARAGRPVRFVLTADGVRKGTAVATVDLEATYARASHAVERGATVTAGDVEAVSGALPGVAFRRVPSAADVVGLRAKRAIALGEPLTAAVLDLPPLVRSGDEVTATVRVGHVEIHSVATASGSGHAGDIIRVLARGSRRPLKARIISQGAVEVIR